MGGTGDDEQLLVVGIGIWFADEVVEVGYMLLKLVGTIHIIIVGIVADNDTRVLHHILDEVEAWNVGIGESLVGVGSVFYHIWKRE